MNSRILVVGPMGIGALAQSYARAFEHLGMQVFRFDPDVALKRASKYSGNRIARRALRSALWSALNHEALEIAQSVRPAMIFAVKCSFFDSETVREIRKLTGIPFVNCYPDNPYNPVRLDPREASSLRRDLIHVLAQYSVVWMWERNLTDRLRGDGVEAKYLPFAFDPELAPTRPSEEGLYCDSCRQNHSVAFVGTGSRARRLELEAVNYPLAIWGDNWPPDWRLSSRKLHLHPAIWGNQVFDVYAKAAVSLNVLNAESMDGHNMRTFEIPGSGGLMLARYTKAQAELFPEDDAAIYYRSGEELNERIEYVLRDRELRARIRRNARRIALDQTYDHRVAAVLRECGVATPTRSNP